MKITAISILIVAVLIGGAIIFLGEKKDFNNGSQDNINNVSIIDGKQIVEITAKGKYAPRASTAKADIPTTFRIQTNGTFDCTVALTIPAINYRKNLPPSGITEIEIPPQKAGTTLQGLCGMGMYNFTVKFN